jgi:hypothetical protein
MDVDRDRIDATPREEKDMNHYHRGIALIGASTILLAGNASAQIRRSSGGTPPPPPPAGSPMKARVPYAGTWSGSSTMKDGPGANEPRQMVMVFDADSGGGPYTGFTVLPNNARAPRDKLALEDGALHWEQPNSGGGRWVYEARLVTRDSIAGNFILLDWPQGEGRKPTGSFGLTRRPAGTP